MGKELEYDSRVQRLNRATVTGFALSVAGLVWLTLVPIAVGQINGPPASVTSIGFGGHFDRAPGPRASVTSLGPNGLGNDNQFFIQPSCCINPLFPSNPQPTLFHGHHRHHTSALFWGAPVYAVPYTPVIMTLPEADEQADQQDDDRGGPTIFDRRGPGTASLANQSLYAERARLDARTAASTSDGGAQPETKPVEDQPQTVLVYKDGHQDEVQNYAVVGSTLYDLTPGRHRKIALADLDLKATAKQNDDRGIDFQTPQAANQN